MQWKLALGDAHTDTWLSKLVSNKQGAVKSEGMSSHTALAEVVPLARGFWRIMTGCILVIGLEALRGADKSISPFLKSDTVETRQWVIMLPIFHPSQTCSHLMKLLDPMLFLRQQWERVNEIPTCSCVWNRWCELGTAPQSSVQYCTRCTDSPSV